MINNPKNRFQRGMIYIFALLATTGIAPFVFIRYANGEWLNALVDLAIVCVALGSAVYTHWRGEATRLASNLVAILYTAGAVTVIYLNETIFVFWLFPSILANFFLLTPNVALFCNFLAITAILPIASRLNTSTEYFAMLSSLLICGCMAYTFALLTHKQQTLLESFANQDPLTHLSNRRALDQEMQLSLEDFARNNIPATLIMLDLDFFKRVNDKYGHSVGDEVLVDLAHLLTKRVRKTDRAFRFGGEEFVVLTRNTALTEAQLIAEQLRQQIEANIKDPDGPVTASFGCAQLHTGETAQEWFDDADKAVYRAKQAGRNCVVTAI
jgi:diguanylate cyclase (GGDEF)-like protein